jgi:tRNA(Ile)-lysidine synthase
VSLEGKILGEIDDLFKMSNPNLNPMGVVLGVSGGPDSVALLLLMAKYSLSTGVKLHVAHVDHGLRGQESKEDASFVTQLAQSLGIAVSIKKVDVESHQARRGISLEEAARELRYDAMAQVVSESGADAVMVGHTSDDQVETVMMHILRGSGLAGLAGMAKISYWHSDLGRRNRQQFLPD